MADLLLVIAGLVVCAFMVLNAVVAIVVLASKQLIPADRGITIYFVMVALVAAAMIAFLGIRVAETSGLLGGKNAVAEEVREANGD
jgi:uncharacterized membrane protein YjgN (DUF898 family)